MEQEQLKNTLEALLFVAAKPFTAKELAKILEQEAAAVQTALDALSETRKESGIVLLNNNGEYQLATNSHYSTQVKNFLNAELREKLTDATVEVLAIIAYRQPISKAEIEAIRGVNSQYSLRNLLMRGMIEKVSNPSDARSFLYQTTTEFLMHLGLTSVKDLPEFEKLVEQIKLPETPAITNANSDEAVKTEEPTILPKVETETIPELEQPAIEQQTPAEDAVVEAEPNETAAEDILEEDEDDETEEDDDEDEDE
ncbi:MAG: SMC-Scp complex subunit ScpB [Candidatus Doudnabacteria bacterium]|nr:SMC-Scp complex subunit ScpB [Candidatus Doudnabacteria bacterium]